MKDLAVLNQELENFTDVEFIDWINSIEHKKSKKLQLKLLIEFNRRNWNYQNLVDIKPNKLMIPGTISVYDSIIFERKTPSPTMTGPFFNKILGPMMRYLSEHPALEGKQLVCFDYVLDQVYMKSKIKIIDIDDLPRLTENDVMVYVTQYGKTFPNRELISPFIKNSTEVIFYKGSGIRNLIKVEVI